MIQPIMITSQEPDGTVVQQTQYQIISQPNVSLAGQGQLLQVSDFCLIFVTVSLFKDC